MCAHELRMVQPLKYFYLNAGRLHCFPLSPYRSHGMVLCPTVEQHRAAYVGGLDRWERRDALQAGSDGSRAEPLDGKALTCGQANSASRPSSCA